MGFSLFTDLVTPTSYKIPDAVNVDSTQNQLDTVSGNAETFSAAKDLAQQFNDFQAQQVSRRLKQTFPQFDSLQSQGAQVIADRLAGRLSTSDAAASQRSSAARALGVGSNVGATTLRDLGIKQYEAQNQGLAELPGFASTVKGMTQAPMFDFSSSFLTASQRWQQTYSNKTNAWNVQNLRNQMAVQPAPWEKALAGFGDSLLTAAGSYLTMGTGNFSSPSGGRRNFDLRQYQMQNQTTGDFGGDPFGGSQFNEGDAAALSKYGLG